MSMVISPYPPPSPIANHLSGMMAVLFSSKFHSVLILDLVFAQYCFVTDFDFVHFSLFLLQIRRSMEIGSSLNR
jgi:hypothetical protein